MDLFWLLEQTTANLIGIDDDISLLKIILIKNTILDKTNLN
jgi:hypothetical protein